MAYTETSTYEYITGDELEAYHITDYSAVDSTNYTEANVMAKVSQAERVVNTMCLPPGESFSTVTDGVKAATLELSRYFMNMQMLDDEYITEFKPSLETVLKLMKIYLARDKKVPDYAGQDFHIPSMKTY